MSAGEHGGDVGRGHAMQVQVDFGGSFEDGPRLW
jgi:hypothetical protein